MTSPLLPGEPGVPVIGVSSYAERAVWGVWDAEAVVLPRTYVTSVTGAGGAAVVLPPEPGVEQVVPRLDGLVLSGGSDIDPARYGARRDAHAQPPVHDRDDAEAALLAAALDAGIPVLGICRGMQMINVCRGGSLLQHLPAVVGHTDHSPTPAGFGRHEVRVEPGSRLARLLRRSGPVVVPTNHHQAVERVGRGLVASAWATDGTVEAVEDPRAGFLVGVQWHPEAGDDHVIFAALVAAARTYADSRAIARVPAAAVPAGTQATGALAAL
ncbi:MAG: gamma-glutamyl-gamma-aminobutyrate hydrolase family protein [Kineosporiaceae bacterium]